MAANVSIVIKSTGAAAAAKDFVDIGSAADKAGKNVEDFGGKADKTSGMLGGLGKALGNIAQIASSIVIAKGLTELPGLISGIGSSSVELSQQGKKAMTVFGDSLPGVEGWAKDSAAAMGLSKREAVNLAAGMADLLVPMGFARETAAGMSEQTIGLAGALAEWSGGTKNSAEVADILTKAMLGERDGLKGLGISITEADVSARLAAQGQSKLTGAALQQAQAQATLALIMEKSVDAQTAFGNGANSAARKQAEMNAAIKDAKDDLAIAMGPAVLFVTTKLAELVPVAIAAATKIGELAKAAGAAGWDKLTSVVEKVGPILADIGAMAFSGLTTLAGLAWDGMSSAWGVIGPALATAAAVSWAGLTALAGLAWDGLSAAWSAIGPYMATAAGLTWDALTALPGLAWAGMQVAWEVMSSAIDAAVGPIQDFASAAADISMDVFSALLGKAGDAFNVIAGIVPTVVGALQPLAAIFISLAGGVVGKLATHFQEAGTALGGLWVAVAQLVAALAPLEPLIKPLAIALGVTLAVALAPLAAAILGVLAALNLLLPVFTGALVGAINVATGAIRTITPVVEGVAKVIGDAVAPIGEALGDLAGKFTEFGGKVVGWVQGAWATVGPLLETPIKLAGIAIGLQLKIAEAAFNALWSAISSWLTTWATIYQKIMEPIIKVALEVGAKGTEIVTGFVGGITGAWQAIWDAINYIHTAVTGAFASAGTWLLEAGKQIVRGLINGISSMVGALRDALSGAITSGINAAKAAAGIKSPSTVMAEEVGVPLGQGVIEGLYAISPVVNAAAAAVAANAVEAAAGYIYTAFDDFGTGLSPDRIAEMQDALMQIRNASVMAGNMGNLGVMTTAQGQQQIPVGPIGFNYNPMATRTAARGKGGNGSISFNNSAVWDTPGSAYNVPMVDWLSSPSTGGYLPDAGPATGTKQTIINVTVQGHVLSAGDLVKTLDEELKRAGEPGLVGAA